ncbi:MAG: HD domain-containing phosphohydrolase [Lachnospiraceae bacterium]
MKRYKQFAFLAVILQVVLIVIIVGFFQVDNMTLARGDVYSFDQGWTLSYPDGKTVQIETLPYHSTCKAGDTLTMEIKVPEQYYGKTIFFLSADKELLVRMDGKEIYSFGKNDKRLFGHTPGSVYNFIDIPEHCDEGILQIEMVSAYDNYAAYLSNMRIADRDVAILQILKENMFNIVCSVILFFTGALLLILALLQRLSGKKGQGMLYLGTLLAWAALYYAIETKILHILYGNQTLYSVMIFSFLLCMPMLLILYYMQLGSCENNKSYQIVLILTFCNIGIQIILQVLNIKDFMDMVFLSHILIFVTIFVVLFNYMSVAKREHEKTIWLEMSALLFMGGGSLIDLCRTYAIKVGDLGKFSRYGTTIYGLLMVFLHIRRMVLNATEEAEANKQYLENEVSRKTKQLQDMFGQSVNALSSAVDAKDRYTNGHSRRVAGYSRMLAERMGLDKEKQNEIYFAGLLHDVGKIRIPDGIINKEGKLTEEEFDCIKLHPVAGYHILKGISAFSMIAVGAKYHHERYDGKGYPNGLTGENIPLVARIIGVADAYDAMTSNRSYRDILPQEVVRQEIVNGKGTQFDPLVADIMLEIIDEDTEYRLRQNDFHKRTILVVDDEIMIRKIVEHVMKEEPMYRVISCADGREALNILEKQPVQLVLLDIEMPEMDGFETLKCIREKYKIPVVFMTGDRNRETLQRAEEMGVDDYLTKPFLPLQLREIVHSVLGN